MPKEGFLGIIDGHTDVLSDLLRQGRNFFEGSTTGQVDLPRLKEGGVGGAFFAIYVGPEDVSNPLDRCLRFYDLLRHLLNEKPDEMALVTTVSQLEEANESGRFGVIMHIEGAEPIDEDLVVLRTLYDLGLRSIGITWSRTNRFAEGVGQDNHGNGLTGAGSRLVSEANRLGIILDVSHLNEEGFWDVVKQSRRPVVATHSNAAAICPHIRNLKDAQIRAIAGSNGAIGINFHTPFLRPDMQANPDTDPGLLVEHIDYIANLVGVEHVAFGSDYDGSIVPPAGMEDVSKFGQLVELLEDRGYSSGDIRKMQSGNWIRVFGDTWR